METNLDAVIEPRVKDLGGFTVRRILPYVKRKTVGPFIFLDEMGPVTMQADGHGIDVRPHPHIGLATVTYLFEGAILATYVISGRVRMQGEELREGSFGVGRDGIDQRVEAVDAAHVIFLGGEPVDGPREIWWNFVSSSKERIERAKKEWREGKFPRVPHDEKDFIPLPNE